MLVEGHSLLGSCAVELDEGAGEEAQGQMGGEPVALVVAVALPAEFLLEPTEELLSVGAELVGGEDLLLGESDGVGSKVEVTLTQNLDQKAKTFEFALKGGLWCLSWRLSSSRFLRSLVTKDHPSP